MARVKHLHYNLRIGIYTKTIAPVETMSLLQRLINTNLDGLKAHYNCRTHHMTASITTIDLIIKPRTGHFGVGDHTV